MPVIAPRPTSRPRLARRAAVLTLTPLLLGGALTLTTAPSAQAATSVGSSACNVNYPNLTGYIKGSGVALRSGPSTSYSVKGRFYTKTYFRAVCMKKGVDWKHTWDYGTVLSGPNKGKTGWVNRPYLWF
ncbi:SH3 domain-containing protein [Streptomyces sp. NBC_01601]|uniref:SH3 domain-containing protein n=1 Tax=Streptomyces sp. NBC_01601 TaxID=2975892 RepID=UPI002E2927B2|nr:SH3 domain-containing protein [Streptomyces sp. NBC_01601]